MVVIQHDGVIDFRRGRRIDRLITAEEAVLVFTRREGFSEVGLGREDRRFIIGRGVFGDLWTMDTCTREEEHRSASGGQELSYNTQGREVSKHGA